jgi:elongation factor G
MTSRNKNAGRGDTRRNFAIMAHIDAGKTTLSERMLWKAGAIRRPGEVHEGNATMDRMSIEQERGITIASAAIRFAWRGWACALIDTPGHVDFSMEVERSLRAVDGAILAICAVAGAQPQTESVWRRITKTRLPCVAIINKMDREGANFEAAVESARARMGAPLVALALPIGSGSEFEGMLDLVHMRALRWSREGAMSIGELSLTERSRASMGRARLVEQLAEAGASRALEWFVQETEPEAQELMEETRKLARLRLIVPAIPVSAYRNQGIESALDLACEILESPSERGFDEDVEFSALVFKTETDSSGPRAFARVMSGRMESSGGFEIASSKAYGSASRMGVPMSDKSEPTLSACAGDVVVFEGLKARTGDTLRARGSNVEHERITPLDPVVGWRVEPAQKSDASKLSEGLARLCLDDPSLRLDAGEAGEWVLWGQGDLHLEVALERLAREFGAHARAGAPQVAYAYRLGEKPAQAQGSVDKQNGGKGQFAKVQLVLERIDSGKVFESALVGEAVPRKFVGAIERGVRAAMECAGAGGHAVLAYKARLTGGEAHAVDSSELAFERAGFEAAKAACLASGMELMEPMGKISCEMPAAVVGALTQEVARRGGRVVSVGESGGQAVLVARAPMSRLFGFVSSARSASSGRASSTIEPQGHEPVKG